MKHKLDGMYRCIFCKQIVTKLIYTRDGQAFYYNFLGPDCPGPEVAVPELCYWGE